MPQATFITKDDNGELLQLTAAVSVPPAVGLGAMVGGCWANPISVWVEPGGHYHALCHVIGDTTNWNPCSVKVPEEAWMVNVRVINAESGPSRFVTYDTPGGTTRDKAEGIFGQEWLEPSRNDVIENLRSINEKLNPADQPQTPPSGTKDPARTAGPQSIRRKKK